MTFEWLGKELERIDEEIRNDALLNGFKKCDDDFFTVVVNDDGHVLGYEPGVPDAPGWKLAVSRQTRGETPVIVYKAVGPAMVILLK